MKKIYMAYNGTIEEVEVLKETEKQYKLVKNRSLRNTLNKSELETKLYGNTIFSKYMENAKNIYNSNLEEAIKTNEMLLQELKNKIIK